jgi:hypothetical protein
MKSIKLLTVALSLAAAAALNATSFTFDAAVNGLAANPNYSFSATGGNVVLGYKADNQGIKFVGVSGGPSGAEIDVGQTLTVHLTNPGYLASLSLALLFNGPEYGDLNEIAQATTSNGDIFQLRLTGEDAASLYKNNVFVSFIFATPGQGSQGGKAGLFEIANPFGSATVTSFVLTPISHDAQGVNKSDFGLTGFQVPDSGSTLALLGAVLLGLAGLSRRFRL